MRLTLLILLFYLVVRTNPWEQFNKRTYKKNNNAREIYNRLVVVMQTIHREGRLRHISLNRIRFFYEQTPHYEMGYIMGEIIERYRKMVNHARRHSTFTSTTVHFMQKKVQVIQHLYFEVIHLCAMMHELESKYKTKVEFQNIHSSITMSEVAKIQKKIVEEQKFKEKEKKRVLKRIHKQRKRSPKSNGSAGELIMYQKPERGKGFWPIEYGWDIGSDW